MYQIILDSCRDLFVDDMAHPPTLGFFSETPMAPSPCSIFPGSFIMFPNGINDLVRSSGLICCQLPTITKCHGSSTRSQPSPFDFPGRSWRAPDGGMSRSLLKKVRQALLTFSGMLGVLDPRMRERHEGIYHDPTAITTLQNRWDFVDTNGIPRLFLYTMATSPGSMFRRIRTEGMGH